MKIAELSVGRSSSPPLKKKITEKSNGQEKKFYRWKSIGNFASNQQKCAGKGGLTMDDPQTPGSDCNSNPATDSITQDPIGSEFIQDNVEYQWCIDYGYREGGLHLHPSVLSSLSTSYSRNDLGYYDDLARNLDANLAEMDMESFRTADIHTLLTALPVMCTEPVQHSEFNYQREQYASISGSVMEKLELGSSLSQPTSSQGDDSACSTTDTISICKSSLLFSPLKETPLLPAGGSYSVDSLDCEDMLLTCQANNKNNYTIAFEGSITMYSDDSQDFENQEKLKVYSTAEPYYDEKVDIRNMLDLSMACSDSKIYTTWSNLKHSSMNKVIARHPSGNNNTIPNFSQTACNNPSTTTTTAKRSRSLPDLSRARDFSHLNAPLNFSVDSADSNVPHNQRHSRNSSSAMSHSINEESSSDSSGGNYGASKKLQNLSLVRLFMKQKSMSAEGMSLTLDQSDSASDGNWPTSQSASGSDSNTNTRIDNRQNAKNANNGQTRLSDFSINWLQTATTREDDRFQTERNSQTTQEITENRQNFERTKDEQVFPVLQSSAELHGNCLQTKNGNGLRQVKQISKTTGVQTIVNTEDDAVQTSLIYEEIVGHNGPVLRETIVGEKPVYVVYPNYVLPDLSFLNLNDGKSSNVALKPHCFAENRKKWKNGNGRPFSCNDIDALRQRGFSHVKDWKSLTLLLPAEYKKILQDFPEVSRHIDVNEETKKPLFCLSPPMRHRNRNTLAEIVPPNTVVSSASSTGTQPSSGYRGSSTILTDWSTNQQQQHNQAVNPLYLYRYADSMSPDASFAKFDEKNVGNRSSFGPTLPKRSISLPYGDQQESGRRNSGKTPPRPPLPRSILRKQRGSGSSKRYSMFEIRAEEIDDPTTRNGKRMSLQEPYFTNDDSRVVQRDRFYDSEKDVDESEEIQVDNESMELEFYGQREEDIAQLEEFFKRSGISSESSDTDVDVDADVKLRSYVRKFLSLRMNKDVTRNVTVDAVDLQRKTVSFAVNRGDGKTIPQEIDGETVPCKNRNSSNFEEKKTMIRCVGRAVALIIDHFDGKTRINEGSDDKTNNLGGNVVRERERNVCAQICLNTLCPALYAIMSDGLKPHLNSTFGPIANSVWQVVEASSQQGPLTKTLNELVRKINGEDVITEGMLKFHAFVFGLLNLRALDAWFAYLCTRESILRKHYSSNGLFVGALSDSNTRGLLDKFLLMLNRLEVYPFQLDLLYQYRQLRNSFGNVANRTFVRHTDCPTKEQNNLSKGSVNNAKIVRPRSCVVYDDLAETRDEGKQSQCKEINGKTRTMVDRWKEEEGEDYTDSLEHSPVNKAVKRTETVDRKGCNNDFKVNGEKNVEDTREETEIDGQERDRPNTSTTSGAKFRKLQEKWELGIIGKEEGLVKLQQPSSPARTPLGSAKSKIPRLLTSPVKHNNVPSPLNPSKNVKSPLGPLASGKKLPAAKNVVTKKSVDQKTGSKDSTGKRTSRLDQETIGERTTRNHPIRPSSLPYKSQNVAAREKNLLSPQRRAASTSLPRPNATVAGFSAKKSSPQVKQTAKEVRTLSHRSPADNGHLAFGEGEKLKVILEVDGKWLLCARGDRKGLVPRSCVHVLQT